MKSIRSVVRLGLIWGASLVATLSLGNAAIARDRGAGIGYSSARDVSYCSTTLTAQDEGARINIRQGPGTGYEAQHYGIEGDWIDILNRNGNPDWWMDAEDNQGYIWYQIGFSSSRAYGWVREDFVELPPIECRN